MMPLLEIDKVSVHFRVRGGFLRSPLTLRAVSDVSLNMSRGETLALVGESGSGKSTLGRSIAGLQRPTRGRIHLNFSRRRRGAPVQMIFQNPFSALDPRMTVEEIVAEPLILAGGDKKNRKERVVEALEQIGMPADAATRYPHEFSGGQCQRIAIARALIGKPELIVADEPLSALDVSIQSKVLNLLGDIRARFGIGYFFISHDFGAVRHLADRIAVLYCGRIMEIARADDMFGMPSHPYTQALLAAIPQIRHGRRKRRCVTRGHTLSRLAQAFVVVVVMSFLLFLLIGLMPGDPIDAMFEGNPSLTPELIAKMHVLYGINQPITLRYWHWLVAAMHGDLGYSSLYFRPVLDVLVPAMFQTIALMAATLVISVPLATLLGVLAARKPNGLLDSVAGLFSFAAVSLPGFWVSLLLIFVFSVKLGWLPASGIPLSNGTSFWSQARHMILPVTVLAMFHMGPMIRHVRGSMIETLSADFVRTARAKGLSERRVVVHHALRNGLMPVTTILALSFGHLFSGALVVEIVFGMLGMGKTIYDAVVNVDFNLALVGLLLATIVVLISNLLADLACAVLDPRITL